MKVTYIDHSGYLVTLGGKALLFDWYRGALPEIKEKLYIFASHRHGDHFSPEIFTIGEKHPGTRYILSNDIPGNKIPEDDYYSCVFMGPGEEKTLDGMVIKTLPSTDEGVAFIIETDGVRLYHAGDLHLWLWGEEDTPQEARDMENRFYEYTAPLKDMHIDIAMLPLDPRLNEEQYALGMEYYNRLARIERIFPMHMWGDYGVIERFGKKTADKELINKIYNITKQGESYEIQT